jgi:two-component system alkaline phosphatase synthesis response regulator PhoP
MKHILVIEDDQDLVKLLGIHLKDNHIEMTSKLDGESGLSEAINCDYSLILLDIMLPKMDGLDVCKEIRKAGNNTPIIMLTSKSEEFDKVLGLEIGADDYITKPFSIRELMARIKAHLRRADVLEKVPQTEKNIKLTFEHLSINLEKRQVELSGNRIELTTKEFELLSLFMQHPGKPYNRQSLLEIVWGYQFSGYEHTVNSHINRLRAKIEPDPANPHFIQTVWGFGYRFMEN